MKSPYVFISYSTKQQEVADALNALIKQCGLSTWMAPYDIPIGGIYAAEIGRAIEESSGCVLLLSEDSQNSIFVGKEVEMAISCRKKVLPVQWGEVTLNAEFKFYIGNCQVVPVERICLQDSGMHKVLISIARLTNHPDFVLPTETTTTPKPEAQPATMPPPKPQPAPKNESAPVTLDDPHPVPGPSGQQPNERVHTPSTQTISPTKKLKLGMVSVFVYVFALIFFELTVLSLFIAFGGEDFRDLFYIPHSGTDFLFLLPLLFGGLTVLHLGHLRVSLRRINRSRATVIEAEADQPKKKMALLLVATILAIICLILTFILTLIVLGDYEWLPLPMISGGLAFLLISHIVVSLSRD